jgi:cellulose synthase/poly-beta-1,6-N-acetylglucosamine synthase-like glycosyltransferase
VFVSSVIEPWELLQECDVIMRKSGITAIILTKNEERNIRNCIESIQGLADRIVVVDSGSTDKTTEIARELGAEIYTHEFPEPGPAAPRIAAGSGLRSGELWYSIY